MGAWCGTRNEIITVYEETEGLGHSGRAFVGGPTWEWPTGGKVHIGKITYSTREQGATFYHSNGQILFSDNALPADS